VRVVVLSNRRDEYVHDAIDSIAQHLTGVSELVVVDDSGDEDHRTRMAARYPDVEVIPVAPDPAGYGVAMQTALDAMGGEHSVLWEEDFRALTTIDLDAAARFLDEDRSLAQVAFLRGPWFGNEHEHGGVIEAREAQGGVFQRGDGLIRHRDHFTCNPTVLPARTFSRPWPTGPWSESLFGRVLTNDGYGFAYLDRGVLVEHVGVRSGFGY
jgi:glycosyltransferase involved in cell wall biosynthesis